MIVIGTKVQERLLGEPDIDLDKSIQLGQAAEVACWQAKILQAQGEEKSMSAITKTMKNEKPSIYSKGQDASNIIQYMFSNCTRGRGNYPAYNKNCNTCGRRSHLSTCCNQKMCQGYE